MAVPPTVLTNEDLEKLVETSDEWITTRTGIKQRHYADQGQTTSDLAAEAARNALDSAGWTAQDLTHILTATLTPDSYCPSASVRIQNKLGLKGCMAMDCNAACSGFVYTLYTASAMCAVDPGAQILVTGVDVLTSRTNWEDRTTCVLFGDAAGAALISSSEGVENPLAVIEDVELSSDGALADLLTVWGGGSGRIYRKGETIDDDFFIQMNGREVYKHAVRNMDEISRLVMRRNNVDIDDVNLFIPHQANLRIIEAVGKKLGFPTEKVFVNVDRYGNTSAASVPLALCEAWTTGAIKPGHTVLVATFGGGFTWGAALLRF